MKANILIVLASSLVVVVAPAAGAQTLGGAVYEIGSGVSAPVLIEQTRPVYDIAAQDANVQGVVSVEAVVLPDGTTDSVRVVTPVDPRVDGSAVDAVKDWLFRPGMREGAPVSVRIRLDIVYSLRAAPGSRPILQAPAVRGIAVFSPGAGVSAPVLVKRVRPRYPIAAQGARIVGLVGLECVVLTDGTVGEVSVVRPLDPTLDREAVAAVRQWVFRPGLKDNTAVQVKLPLDVVFSGR